jgi:hypothetical protein
MYSGPNPSNPKLHFSIVTEGHFEEKFLSELFSHQEFPNSHTIMPADGYSSALSKVKSLLSNGLENIILLLDTDTTDEKIAKEKRDFVNWYININEKDKNPKVKVIWSKPEFEIVFLENKKFLPQEIRDKFGEEFWELAKNAPKSTLDKYFYNISRNPDAYLSLLKEEKVRNDFFKTGPIKDICAFLNKVKTPPIRRAKNSAPPKI